MELSVVVPTLNGRERVGECLDALAARAPAAEVVVVNGPSADGTSGLVREHPATDILIEVAERNLNVARNAGLDASAGDVVALVGQDSVPEDGWLDGVLEAVRDGADVVTGPVHRAVEGGVTTQRPEHDGLAGREVTFFDGGNVALTRPVVDALDGFDEYLDTGGARDAAHRLAHLGYEVQWRPDTSVLRTDLYDIADRTVRDEHGRWGIKHRALAYRLAKNYGPRPAVARRVLRHAGGDARDVLGAVRTGDEPPSRWLGSGRDVVENAAVGLADGLRARLADRSDRLNPNGISARMDRAIARFEP